MYFEKVQEKIVIDKVGLVSGSRLSEAVSPLSCHNNNNVPKPKDEKQENECSWDFAVDDSEIVIDELHRNTEYFDIEDYRSCDSSVSSRKKIITSHSEDLKKQIRLDNRELKKKILREKNIDVAKRVFAKKMERVENNGVLVIGTNAQVKVVPYKANCRYFKEGRQNIRRQIFKKYGDARISKDGVFLTLTYDPKKIDVFDAWVNVGSHCRSFIKNLNRSRKKHFGDGCGNLKYFRVVEAHKNSYPHVHYYFPSLKWLWHHNKNQNDASKNSWDNVRDGLLELWGHGRVNVQKCKRKGKVANYVASYVGKLKDADDVVKVLMWLCSTRLYSFSSGWGDDGDGEEKELVCWHILGSCSVKEFSRLVNRLGYRVSFERKFRAPGAPPDFVDSENFYVDEWKYSSSGLAEIGYYQQ